MQKIAFEARLRNRKLNENTGKQVDQITEVSVSILEMTMALLSPEKQL